MALDHARAATGPELGIERIRGPIDECSAELDRWGQIAQFFVVDGGAIALAYDETCLARDVAKAFEMNATSMRP